VVLLQPGVHLLVEQPHLGEPVLLLQQDAQQVAAQEAAAAGDQVQAVPSGRRHRALLGPRSVPFGSLRVPFGFRPVSFAAVCSLDAMRPVEHLILLQLLPLALAEGSGVRGPVIRSFWTDGEAPPNHTKTIKWGPLFHSIPPVTYYTNSLSLSIQFNVKSCIGMGETYIYIAKASGK